jgi:hypothetical protein
MATKRVKRGYFSKVSTGEILVFTGPVAFLNRTGSSSDSSWSILFHLTLLYPLK